MLKYLSALKNKNFSGKICLLRVNFDISEAELKHINLTKHKIPLRVKEVLPTIEFLLKRGAKVVLLSHRGRPKARIDADLTRTDTEKFRLKPFVKILSALLKKPIYFIDFNKNLSQSIISSSQDDNIKKARPGTIFLLENIRFLSGEEKSDRNLAKQLASLGDFYVNDAFSVSHRKNVSVAAITEFLPSCAGLSLEKEIRNLDKIMRRTQKPFVVILGGAKIADKIGLIKNFWNKANYFLIGGGIANTIFAAQGLPIGESLYESNILTSDVNKLILPEDVVAYQRKILDIGPNTIKKYQQIIKRAKTIIWNGPMGYIENPRFAKGSKAILQAIIKSRAFSVIGGGDTASLIQNSPPLADPLQAKKFMIHNSRVFISTGGGAMLEYLSGKKLAGIIALEHNRNKIEIP